VPTTNPISAAIAAFGALGVERIGVVTPYSERVTIPVINLFEQAGFDVPTFGSFLVEDDLAVARTTPDAIAEGLRTVDDAAACDAFFVSCTSVRSFAQVEDLEREFGRPVVSSNLALAWHLLRLAEVSDSVEQLGTLMRTP
jgi:maleate isomerase